jgi:LysM repeat protein
MFDKKVIAPPTPTNHHLHLKAALTFALLALAMTGFSSTASDATGRPQVRLDHMQAPTEVTLASIVVQRGDSLYRIARRHNVSVEALQFANSLTSEKIQVGQRLVLLTH